MELIKKQLVDFGEEKIEEKLHLEVIKSLSDKSFGEVSISYISPIESTGFYLDVEEISELISWLKQAKKTIRERKKK